MVAIPLESPSILSSRLNAFVIPTTQKSVTMMSIIPLKRRTCTPADDENAGGSHLYGQLDVAPQTAAVVQRANEADQRGADKNADDLIDVTAFAPEGQGDDKGNVDGSASHQRHRRSVELAFGGLVEDPQPQNCVAHQGGTANGDDKRAGGHQEKSTHRTIRFPVSA